MGTHIEDRRGRLTWLEGERRELASKADFLCTARNWTALLEKCADLIEVEAEIRGLTAKSRPQP